MLLALFLCLALPLLLSFTLRLTLPLTLPLLLFLQVQRSAFTFARSHFGCSVQRCFLGDIMPQKKKTTTNTSATNKAMPARQVSTANANNAKKAVPARKAARTKVTKKNEKEMVHKGAAAFSVPGCLQGTDGKEEGGAEEAKNYGQR